MFQKHFDNAQFESHRQDGLRKLRPDAVPMVFELHDTPAVAHEKKRKPVTKHGINSNFNFKVVIISIHLG
jgi:hypothetical protein